MRKEWKEIMKRQDSMPLIEVGFSILSMCLAFVFFGSPDLFDRLPGTYEFFKAIGPESVWATIFLLAAFTKLLGLATKQIRVRKAGLLGSTIIYGLIASAYFLGSGWFNIGFFTYAVLAFLALFAVREVGLKNGK
ncbi:hypothetical protein FQ085_11555 [Planococcus sp. ANT_H30]|uniref:hypothetical protein n=1 Tax=Planococcus sp. ANT_H30 TaxID=2597347 RepID=UPI0011EF37A7|nr:hypothetical protein [Planococcus sp. ANT_H30]KAA0956623.1 hypothetical protein FQ085_11555 [Planococcus sp. ANT_H30]